MKGYQTPMEAATMWNRSGLAQSTLSQVSITLPRVFIVNPCTYFISIVKIWQTIEKRPDGNVGPAAFCQAMRLISAAQQLTPLDVEVMNRRISTFCALVTRESLYIEFSHMYSC